jgi:hypothetical protein
MDRGVGRKGKGKGREDRPGVGKGWRGGRSGGGA